MADLSEQIREALEGTCLSTSEAADRLGLSEYTVVTNIVTADIERCETCSWWVDVSETDIVDDEHMCEECQNDV